MSKLDDIIEDFDYKAHKSITPRLGAFKNALKEVMLAVIGDDVPETGATKPRRYSDFEMVHTINSTKAEMRRKVNGL